jgi:ClpP class serine protease
MMNPLLARFADVPSLIEPSYAARFEADLGAVMQDERVGPMLSSHASADDDFWFAADDWRSAYRPYVVRDGILMIPVKGVLLHDFPWALGSFATGYLYITKALERGLQDGNVRGVALLGSSYGGEGLGCFEASNRIFDGRGIKPIHAFVDTAYSAGYAICSAADSMIASTTSGTGSIGVVMTHVDVSRAVEDAGMKITFVHFGKHKVDGNRYQPLPADVQAKWQSWCDEQGLMFCNLVARNRGLDLKVVQGTEADCYSSSEALKLGLIDAIAPLDDAMAVFNTDPSAADDETEETEMNDKTNAAAATTTQLEAATAAGRTEGIAAGKLEGAKEGTTAERTRISSILGCEEAKGRTTLAQHLAFSTDMTVEAAKGMLNVAAKETAATTANAANPLDAAMSRHPNPTVGADTNTGDQTDDQKAAAMASSIVTAYRGPAKNAA